VLDVFQNDNNIGLKSCCDVAVSATNLTQVMRAIRGGALQKGI
jgi:hypothetical protein